MGPAWHRRSGLARFFRNNLTVPYTVPYVPNMANALGARFKRARRAAYLTQQALADAADTSQETVSRIESGTHAPGSELLQRIAVALNVTTDWLLSGSGEPVARGGSRQLRYSKRK